MAVICASLSSSVVGRLLDGALSPQFVLIELGESAPDEGPKP
jgi:hypothetical protein